MGLDPPSDDEARERIPSILSNPNVIIMFTRVRH
jgi:hypothetical protein